MQAGRQVGGNGTLVCEATSMATNRVGGGGGGCSTKTVPKLVWPRQQQPCSSCYSCWLVLLVWTRIASHRTEPQRKPQALDFPQPSNH